MAEPLQPRNPFRAATFGGYHREDVDAYLEDAQRLQQRLEDETSVLKAQAERLQAELEAQGQEHELQLSRQESETEATRMRLRDLRDELERSKIEAAKANERAEAMAAERDTYQRVAEKLAAEEQQTRDVLRAASRTAEEMKAEAKAEADEIRNRAETNARRLEEDAHQRIDVLKREYERARRDYDDFLKQAKDVTENLSRKIDEARAKWTV